MGSSFEFWRMGIWFALKELHGSSKLRRNCVYSGKEPRVGSNRTARGGGVAARPPPTSGMLCCSLWNATEFGASSQAQVMVGYDRVQKNFKIDRILWICLIFRALFQCILDRAAARSASESRGCSGANGARPRCPSTSAGYALHSLGQILWNDSSQLHSVRCNGQVVSTEKLGLCCSSLF